MRSLPKRKMKEISYLIDHIQNQKGSALLKHLSKSVQFLMIMTSYEVILTFADAPICRRGSGSNLILSSKIASNEEKVKENRDYLGYPRGYLSIHQFDIK